jgi:hypothetical protein
MEEGQGVAAFPGARIESRSMRHRVLLAFILAGLVQTAREPVVAAGRAPSDETRCSTSAARESAYRAFVGGVEAFERKQWLRAAHRMAEALRTGCTGDRLNSYGRWSYDYQPETYLGVALVRLGRCLEPGRFCAQSRNWQGSWARFLELRLGLGGSPLLFDRPLPNACAARLESAEGCDYRCSELRGSGEKYCPVIHWRQELRQTEAYPLEIPESEKAARCSELRSLVGFFLEAFTARTNDNVRVCRQAFSALECLEKTCSEGDLAVLALCLPPSPWSSGE